MQAKWVNNAKGAPQAKKKFIYFQIVAEDRVKRLFTPTDARLPLLTPVYPY